MDSFLYSINATVPIFLVMIVGWVIKQLGVIDDHFANVANKYVFKVALPVLLFRDLAAADFKSQFDVKFVLYCMIVTTIMFSGIWICTVNSHSCKNLCLRNIRSYNISKHHQAFFKNLCCIFFNK